MDRVTGPTEPSRPTIKRLFAVSGNCWRFQAAIVPWWTRPVVLSSGKSAISRARNPIPPAMTRPRLPRRGTLLRTSSCSAGDTIRLSTTTKESILSNG